MTPQSKHDETTKFVHETFVEVIKFINNKILDLKMDDREKWLIQNRIINRIYVHYNTITYKKAAIESMKEGDL